MGWEKSAEDRRREQQVYGSPEYRRNRAVARRRAAGRCEDCGHAHPKLQCDHIVPKSRGGGNELANLMMRCTGDGSCKCHDRKTASEGGGYRRPAETRDPEPRRIRF